MRFIVFDLEKLQNLSSFNPKNLQYRWRASYKNTIRQLSILFERCYEDAKF